MTRSQKEGTRTPVRFQTAREGRLTPEEFTIRAIENLREEGYKGIHTRRTGFNDLYKEYFGEDADPIAATRKLAESGKIVIGGSRDRAGVMLYKPGEEPEWMKRLHETTKKTSPEGPSVGLAKILGASKTK